MDYRETASKTGNASQFGLPAVSIVAPAYNERANIRPLAHAIADAMKGFY